MVQKYFFIFFALLSACSATDIKNKAIHETGYQKASDVKYPRAQAEAFGDKYAISTQGIYATQAAQGVLKRGGNLIDAFVTASFVISVERPQSTGIAGGGFLVFKPAGQETVYAVDFRERAPLAAHRDMYLDVNKKYLDRLSKDGILSVATPGLVRGLWEVHQKFGKKSWSDLIQPAIHLADQGFPVYENLERALRDRQSVISKDAAAAKIFLNTQGQALSRGSLLKQKDLARTLRLIAQNGAREFYEGSTAQKIVQYSKKNKGLLTMQDFKSYQVHWRKPVSSDFMGFKVFSMPPPSSGGIHVLQFLNILENEKWSAMQINQASVIHTEAAALQMAFADRAVYLGDPDFVQVPQESLTSKAYALKRRSEIKPNLARHDIEVKAGAIGPEHDETTHLALMDDQGNAISSTQTINGWMGSAIVVPGTGLLLNNEMDDFSAKPGVANLFGAVGGEANAIAPLKTPLSSMSPTLVLDSHMQPVLSVGAPGGTKIISCTAQTILNNIYYKLPLWESVTNIRYHHQWKPDELLIEAPGPILSEKQKLEKMGYQLKVAEVPCKVMAVSKSLSQIGSGKSLNAVADPRDIGTSLAE